MSEATELTHVPLERQLPPEARFHELMALATQLVATGFLPKAITTPAQAVAIILTGRELGIGTMQALRSINVIQGKVALSAELMAAKILQCGHKLEWTENSDTKAAVRITRKDGTSHEDSFTMDEAKKAGLLGKDSWAKFPKAMLRARALSLTARAICPDAISGTYTPEELGAEVDGEGGVINVTPLNPYAPTPVGTMGALGVGNPIPIPTPLQHAIHAKVVDATKPTVPFGQHPVPAADVLL